jgi:hypothetical protein
MDTQMDEHAGEVPLFDETDYSTWRIEMKGYLKEKGAGVWNTVVGGSVPSKNQTKGATQKEAKKNNAVAFKTILNGLSGSVKESIGKCTSTKDLWLKLEKVYQDKEDNSIKDNEGKDSTKSSVCNNSKCDDVECSSTNEEENLEVVCVESVDSYLIDEEEDLLKLKDKVLSELDDVSYEIGNSSTSFEYLEKYTKEILEEYPRHTMALKQMLKEQEESKKTQLEEKEEEIKRLKNEIISQAEEKKKVDDELRKILEVNVNLKTQIEEAKRIEELLKNQVNEKEESCHKLEAEVVDLRRKEEKEKRFMSKLNNPG